MVIVIAMVMVIVMIDGNGGDFGGNSNGGS